MTAALWKGIAIVLLALLLIVGGGWWLASGARDQALVDLHAERGVSEQLRAGIREQNRATEALAKAKEAADARGQAARQLAAANGRRFDGALEQIKNVKATTCAEAMPAVNAILEAIR